MSDVIVLNHFRKVGIQINPVSLSQKSFKPHERRAIGDIQSSLVSIGFSHDPTMKFMASPDIEGQNNRIILEIDVADSNYQAIFGEMFDISITKFQWFLPSEFRLCFVIVFIV